MNSRALFHSASLGLVLMTARSANAQHVSDQSDTTVFRSLDAALVRPDAVRRLDLSNVELTAFPLEILELANLEELRLRNDGLSSLPEEIGELKKLRLLDLSGNPISVLPARFTELVGLQELYLNEDNVLDLEADIAALAELPKLRALHLERDGLTELPGNISKLAALEELYLNGNQLERVPPPLMMMPKLKLIELHENPMDPLMPIEMQQRGVLIRF